MDLTINTVKIPGNVYINGEKAIGSLTVDFDENLGRIEGDVFIFGNRYQGCLKTITSDKNFKLEGDLTINGKKQYWKIDVNFGESFCNLKGDLSLFGNRYQGYLEAFKSEDISEVDGELIINGQKNSWKIKEKKLFPNKVHYDVDMFIHSKEMKGQMEIETLGNLKKVNAEWCVDGKKYQEYYEIKFSEEDLELNNTEETGIRTTMEIQNSELDIQTNSFKIDGDIVINEDRFPVYVKVKKTPNNWTMDASLEVNKKTYYGQIEVDLINLFSTVDWLINGKRYQGMIEVDTASTSCRIDWWINGKRYPCQDDKNEKSNSKDRLKLFKARTVKPKPKDSKKNKKR